MSAICCRIESISSSSCSTRLVIAAIVALIVSTSLSMRELIVATWLAISSRNSPSSVEIAIDMADLYASVISALAVIKSCCNWIISSVFFAIALALLLIAVALAEIRDAFLAISSAFLAISEAFLAMAASVEAFKFCIASLLASIAELLDLMLA